MSHTVFCAWFKVLESRLQGANSADFLCICRYRQQSLQVNFFRFDFDFMANGFVLGYLK